MTKTNYQRVIEDIRAGRTELVWRVAKDTTAPLYEGTIKERVIFYIWPQMYEGKNFAWAPYFTKEGEVIKDRMEVSKISFEEHPWCNDWHRVSSYPGRQNETEAKLQQLYNDYLLDEARKKDERMVV